MKALTPILYIIFFNVRHSHLVAALWRPLSKLNGRNMIKALNKRFAALMRYRTGIVEGIKEDPKVESDSMFRVYINV